MPFIESRVVSQLLLLQKSGNSAGGRIKLGSLRLAHKVTSKLKAKIAQTSAAVLDKMLAEIHARRQIIEEQLSRVKPPPVINEKALPQLNTFLHEQLESLEAVLSADDVPSVVKNTLLKQIVRRADLIGCADPEQPFGVVVHLTPLSPTSPELCVWNVLGY